MINLLPAKDQNKIKKERLRRLAVVFCLFISILLFVGIVALLPSASFVYFQKGILSRQLAVATNNPIFNRAEEIEKSINDLNFKLRAFAANQSNVEAPSSFLEDVILRKKDNVSVNAVVFGESRTSVGKKVKAVTIRGTTVNRDFLLDFITELEKSAFFTKVNSPVTNLLEQNNIEFVLILEIDESKL